MPALLEGFKAQAAAGPRLAAAAVEVKNALKEGWRAARQVLTAGPPAKGEHYTPPVNLDNGAGGGGGSRWRREEKGISSGSTRRVRKGGKGPLCCPLSTFSPVP